MWLSLFVSHQCTKFYRNQSRVYWYMMIIDMYKIWSKLDNILPKTYFRYGDRSPFSIFYLARPPFQQILRDHVRTDPGNTFVKFKFVALTALKLWAFNGQNISVVTRPRPRDPCHAPFSKKSMIPDLTYWPWKHLCQICVKSDVRSFNRFEAININGQNISVVTWPWPRPFSKNFQGPCLNWSWKHVCVCQIWSS